jgi:hypothetical protein
MAISNYTTNSSLGLLNSEAISLLDQAKKYRAEMEKLPTDDQRRQIYEQMIRDLLDRSRSLSVTVTTSASSS